MNLIFGALKACAMRISAGSTDFVTSDAKLLSRAAMTTRTRCWIHSRLETVSATTATRRDPAGGVRTTRRAARDIWRSMAVDAGALAMTRGAKARVSARFLGVARAKTSAVQAWKLRIVECQSCRKRRDGTYAVTTGARSFGVTTRTKLALTSSAYTMLTDPIAVVNEMTGRESILGAEIDVTAIAVAKGPLIFMLMTTKAERHLG
jgi:hypothetical protein